LRNPLNPAAFRLAQNQRGVKPRTLFLRDGKAFVVMLYAGKRISPGINIVSGLLGIGELKLSIRAEHCGEKREKQHDKAVSEYE